MGKNIKMGLEKKTREGRKTKKRTDDEEQSKEGE